MKLPCLLQPRILKEAIRALVKGPYTTRFPFKPHKPFDSFRGKPQFNKDECMGCLACSQVCPTGAISFKDLNQDGKAVRIISLGLDMCIFCGHCQANCPTEKGIVLTQEFDLANTESRDKLTQDIEKELILCEGCNHIIAPHDQLLWVAKKLGPLLYTNTSLLLYYLKNSYLAELAESLSPQAPTLRRDRIKILCPKCRRESVLKS